jgi:FdhD protein
MRHAPQSAKSTQVTEWDEGRRRSVLDEVAVEEPLEIRVNGQPVGVTMRTPGDDFDLAAGFLLTEGILTSRGDIQQIAYGKDEHGQTTGNRVQVTLAARVEVDLSRLEGRAVANSSCGICGRASIEAVRARDLAPSNSTFTISAERLTELPAVLRSSQRVFGRTGGLHAAALFNGDGTTLAVCEDIGRHNAVDKAIGRALLTDALPFSTSVLVVSGRGGFEIIQKALVVGVPIVASVSAPSSLAVQLAREFNLTLIGFLRGRRFIVYAGDQRLSPTETQRVEKK